MNDVFHSLMNALSFSYDIVYMTNIDTYLNNVTLCKNGITFAIFWDVASFTYKFYVLENDTHKPLCTVNASNRDEAHEQLVRLLHVLTSVHETLLG